MPVDQASYRPFEGARRPGRRISFAIASTMIRKLRRGIFVKLFIFGFPAFVCLFAVVFLSLFYMNAELLPGPWKALGSRLNLLEMMNRAVQDRIGFFSLLLAALVGAPLIAEDRRARALPLYFSRPLTHLDYVLGKVYTLFFFLGIALLGPPILMYVAEIALNPKEGVIVDQLPTLGRSLVPSLLRIISLSAVALGVSSLARRTNHAALLVFGILLPVHAVAVILAHGIFDNPDWLALSPKGSIDRITADILPNPAVGRRGPAASMGLSLTLAWVSLAGWTVLGFGVLFARIRKVEVVT